MTIQQNTIADELDKETPFDKQCKVVLSDPQILAYIIKNCVTECKNVDMNDLVQYFKKYPPQTGIEDISISGGKIIYDIQTQLLNKGGIIINIEPQNNVYPGYNLGIRAIYYNSRLISNQKGTIFKHSNFNAIKKVYSIWIIRTHAKEDNGVIAKIRYIYEEKGRQTQNLSHKKKLRLKEKIKKFKRLFDLSEIIMIYPDIEHTKYDGSFIDFFSILFNVHISSKQKKLLVEEKYGIIMSEELVKGVENMCNWTESVVYETKVEVRRNIMDTMSLNLYQAMDALKISDDERPYIINQLEDYKKKSKKSKKTSEI